MGLPSIMLNGRLHSDFKKNFFVIAIVLALLFIATSSHAQEIVGEVVGISDGDTIKVLQNKTQYKIRLYGIDTPERKQAFGTKIVLLNLRIPKGKRGKE